MKTKIDLYKLHKADYVTPKKPVLIQMKKASYLAIAGQGEPGGAVFTAKIGALYGMAFTVKMTRKFGGKQDYAVCKLEAQWSAAEGGGDFSSVPRDQWRWKLMIRTPEFVKKDELKVAVAILLKRGKGAEVQEVQLETLTEGRCVQMLHVGPYDREPESIALMKAFAGEQGFKFHGLHHEIYLSDPRRVPAERLKTILRMPVARV
jgi:hypothetical protein